MPLPNVMPDIKQYYPFDFEFTHIVKEIKAPVSIYSSRNSIEGKCIKIDALWDTGASISVLSPKLVHELALSPVDNWYVGGIDNEISSDVVIITMILPNGMVLTDKRFSVCNIPGVEVLIGMDIISMGDFSISNANGKTLFSFVMPPYKNKISYSKLINEQK